MIFFSKGLTDGQRMWGTIITAIPFLALSWIVFSPLGFAQFSQSHPNIVYVVYAVFAVTGLVMYWVREHRRIAYGFLEIAVALTLLWPAVTNFLPKFINLVSSNGANNAILLANPVAILAGIYVMIRGFDNIGVGLANHPKALERWNWLSLKTPKEVQPPPESSPEPDTVAAEKIAEVQTAIENDGKPAQA